MPIYRFNSKVYDIPDDVVKDFEKDRPTATIAYKNGEDIYDIQVNQREQFLKQFPEAELYDERANDITQVGGVTQAGDITQGSALMQGESTTDQAVPDAEIQRLKNIQSTAQQQIDNASFFDRFFDADTRAAVATRNKAEEALEVYDEANREKENWFDRNVVGAFKGFVDKVGDLSTWDMGASGLASAKALNDAYTKWENGEKLTTAEQNMLDAYGLATAVQSAYQDKVGAAYNVGGSLPESLAFGASLAINPAGGVGKKLAESAAKAAVKKYGASFVSKLAKGAARVGGDVLEMGVATAVPGAGRVAEDYYNRLNGQSTFEIDDNGIIRYGGQQEQEEADDAIWKAFGSQFIENYSEAMGNYFAPMGSVLSNLTSKGLKAAHLGKLADVVNDISSSQFSKSLQRFKDATKFDGLVGEYLEEVAGNVMNAATVGDMNFNSPDDPRSVFNPETNIETFLSCALLSGTMYAVEAPISMYNKNVAKKNLTNADIAATKVWDKDRWDDLRSQMDEADPQLLAQLLTGVQNATDLNDEQKQAAKDYGMRLMQFQGYNARRMQNTSESTSDANEINNAYDDGADIQAPYDKHSAKVAADRAETSLGEDPEFNQAVISGAETPVATINAMAESGKYTEEQIQKAKDYYVAINRMNGMTDALLDEVDAKIESANVEVDMNTNKDLGQVIQVTLRDGSVGYVVQGSVNSSEDGSIDVNNSDDTIMVRLQNGEVKMMNPGKDLRGVTWAETPDALKDANNNQLRMNLIDQGIAEIDWNPATPNPKVGDAYVVDGVPTTIVGEDGKGGLYVVPTEKWQEVQGNEIKMQQLVEQASQNPIPVASFKQWASDQLDAQEEAQMQQEQAETSSSEIPNNQEEMLPAEQPVATTEEGVAVKEESVQQVVPTKEDGSIDFVAYGIGNSLKELGNAYGEKMPHKVEVTAKAFADDLIKAQKAIEKAQEALDNAPIGRDAKQKESLEKARIAYEEVKKEADFWAEMDADIKKAQEERESLTNPKAELDLSDEPMTTEEFIAKALADGGIRLTADSYKKELGYGEKERKKFLKMFAKAENGGVSVERAGEWLMQWDRENGTNFFDQTDANAGRDALINFLGSVQTWGDITGYTRSNREYQAQRESEALKEEIETAIEQNYHMAPGDYATSKEVEAVENPFEGVDLEELDAIFALTLEEYYEYERNQSNEQGAEASIAEGSNDVLLEEQADNTGRTEQGKSARETGSDIPRTGTESGSAQADETRSRRFVNPLEAAERIDKEERRLRPIRHRLREWAAAGIVVNVVERVEDIPNRSVESAINGGAIVPGWYEVSNGQVYIYLPHVRSVKDLDETIIHEALSHKGIRNLIGEKRFGELCDKVWDSMPEDAKTKYSDYEGVRDIKDEKRKQRAAADEYMAHLAEQQNLSPQEKTIWENIVMFFRDLLDKALNGILSKSEITDDDIAKLIRISYANLKSGAEGGLGETGTRFSAKKKRALETVSTSRKKHQQTVISSADGAKILNNLDNLAEKYENDTHTKEKTFIGEVAKAIEARKQGSGSQYATFETINGNVVTIRLANHNATVSNFDNRDENEGISIVVSAKDNNGITNDGDAHIVEYFYDSIDLRRADGKPLAEIVKSIKQSLYSGEFKDTTGLAGRQEVNESRFRVVNDKNGRKTLVGLHNISEEKLRKAIKQGGLANPSMAVIDLDKQSHVDYGDITLIAPSSLIDKKSGKNIGTYTADAWTPIYPNIEKRMSDKGAKAYSKSLESVPSELRNKVRLYFNAYLEDGNTSGALNYWFLHDTGKNPPLLTSQSNDYTNEELDAIEAISNAGYYSGLNEEEKQKVLDLFIEKQGGKDAFDAKIAERIETMKNNLQRPDLKAFMKNKVEQKLQEIQEYGYDYEQVSNFYSNAQRAINNRGKIDEFRTFRNAQDIVNNEGLQGELNEWLADKEEQFGVEEYLFVGYNNNGDRKYLPNTLENASKLMRKEGRAGATGLHGFNHFVATLAPNAGTLTQINKKKGNLSTQEEYDAFREKWGDVYHELAKQLQPDATGYADYGYYRLEEMPTVKNPKEYVKKEYGIELSDEFMKEYNEFVSAIKNDFPARYFETKFERPVYLNEFAAAVVPQGTSKNVVDALTDAGLQIEEYESGNNETRMAAVDKVSSETEGVRFRVSNRNQEIFAHEPAIDYVSQANDVVEVPRDEVMYTMNNIASQLYKTSGRFMRQLYQNGTLGRVLKGDYAEIDQIKAKNEYDHAKPILDEYLNELVWMKYQATDAAQEVINGVISDVEYAIKYYKDLSLGKDVWRTEERPRFRIVEKQREDVNKGVDSFTSKYNSKPVSVASSEMTDEELEKAIPTSLVEDTRKAIEEGVKGKYSVKADKIYIFADNVTKEELEDTLFHENLHPMFSGNPIIEEFYTNFNAKYPEQVKMLAEGYEESEVPEEVFVTNLAVGMQRGNFKMVEPFLAESSRENLYNTLKAFGYDYEQERGRRNPERNSGKGSDVAEGKKVANRSRGKEDSEGQRESSREQAEKLRDLFGRVADMGLDGVLGNGEYTSLMADIYKALPEDVRKEVDGNALRYYGGNVAPAVSDYIVADGKANIIDKVVGFIKEALRKAGYDLDLTQNDVKYLLWRSKKPLKSYDALDVAEDIDAKRNFGVDKEGGTRFRSSNAKQPFDPSDRRAKIVKEYDPFLKTGKFNFIEAFQDRMYSVKVFMDMIVKATGKKVRDFEDAYKAENQLGSINKPAEEKYLKNFYKPLVETIRELSGKYGREAIERYIYCKSGLERNEVLRQRDADEAYNDAKAELDGKLAKNQITQAQYNTLLQQADAKRQQTLAEDVDYSGIRGMLYNMKAQAINKDYEEGRIDKATRDARLDNLEANKKTEVQDWKQFAENQVATIENQASSAELNALWKKINAATNETLRIDYESGMIDKSTYDAEKAMMKYYVPLRNWADTTAEEMYEYRSELVRPVSSNQKRAKGRESQADNPIATIALMAQNAIVRGNRNKVKQKFYAFVANRETGLASVRDVWYVRDQNGDWVPQYADTTQAKDAAEFAQILQDFETDMQLLEAQGDAYKGKLPQGMKFRANRQQKMSHVVAVMINGKEYAVYVNGNPRPAQAINGETNSEAANASAWYDKLKRIYGAGLTSWNPDFIIPNMIRDGIHATTMTMIDAGPFAAARFALNGPKAFAQVFAMVSGVGKNLVNPRNQAYFEEFVANGGETGYTAINTLEDYKKEYDKLMKEVKGLKGKNLFKNGFEAIGKWLEAANRIFEDVNRFNAYVSARESGESIMRSVDAAKNITVNFNRKGALSANSSVFGTIANAMSKWILFFNPAVQGIAQLVTKTKMNPGRAIAMSGTILSSGFVMPMLNEILVAANGGDDEDDYWNQSDFKRRNNWMLFTGDGYVSVPLPPVLRELYGIGDIIYGSITGHITPERAAMDMARQVQSAIGFVNLIPEASQEPDMVTWAKGFAPDLASPVLDVISNTNFMGRPIAKWTSFNEYDPEYERVYKGVSPLWVELSKLLNEVGGNEGRRSDVWGNFINPAMMEHLFNSYGGGIGKTINNLSGMIWDGIKGNTENLDPYRKSPILPRFYTPNDEKTVVPAINRKYYDYEYMFNTAKKALKNYQEGVKSKEHPEYQKYIDEMKGNGEIQFIKFFEQESKRLKKIQNLIKGDPSNKKELEERMIDMKADIATKCYEMLN